MKLQLSRFHIKKKFKKGGIHIDREIYWDASLAAGVVIILLGLFMSIGTFKKVDDEFVTTATTQALPTAIDKISLQNVLDYFSAREQKYAQIISSPAPVVDPSL